MNKYRMNITPVGRTRPWAGYMPGDGVIRTDGSDHAPGPGEYKPMQWVDPATGDIFPNTYQVGEIMLVLFDYNSFFLVVAETGQHFALPAAFTTCLEDVIRGCHELDNACHWDEFEELSPDTRMYLYSLTELTYENSFGAEFEVSLFGKAFHRAIANYIMAEKALY